jgi:hypothetical protein
VITIIRMQDVLDLQQEGGVRSVMVISNSAGVLAELDVTPEQAAAIMQLHASDTGGRTVRSVDLQQPPQRVAPAPVQQPALPSTEPSSISQVAPPQSPFAQAQTAPAPQLQAVQQPQQNFSTFVQEDEPSPQFEESTPGEQSYGGLGQL